MLLVDGLKRNLLSVSQICDRGHDIVFRKQGFEILKSGSSKIVAVGTRTDGNLYTLSDPSTESCSISRVSEDWLWHRRLGHIGFRNLSKIGSNKAVRDLPVISSAQDNACEACQKGKQTRASFKPKEHNTSNPLELVHTDLCGPMRTQSLSGDKYFMLFIDDFSRMTWVMFLRHKNEALENFKVFKN